MRKVFLAVALAVAFSSAAARAATPGVQVKDDKFSAQVTFIGPQQMVNPFGGTMRRWFIRSWLNKSDRTVTHQIYVDTTYFWHWRFWEVAADDHAVSHPVEKIDSSVDDCGGGMCSYTEDVAVDLDDAFLRQRAAEGFQIKLTAKSGDELVLTISPSQIQPVLQAIDGYMGASAPAPGVVAAASNGDGVFLGVLAVDVPAVVSTMIGRPGLHAMMIASVTPGSVAAKAGLAQGDVVTSYAGKPISGRDDFLAAVRATKPGDAVALGIVRGGKDQTLNLLF